MSDDLENGLLCRDCLFGLLLERGRLLAALSRNEEQKKRCGMRRQRVDGIRNDLRRIPMFACDVGFLNRVRDLGSHNVALAVQISSH